MSNSPDPAAQAQRIVEALRAGGATDLQVATDPVWVVGHVPSGRRMQLFWDAAESGYYVSRWIEGPAVTEELGIFPAWEAAVACALRA